MNNYEYVNVYMGTLNSRRFSNGNIFPLTAVPHGMASFTIQTNGAEGNWFFSPLSKSFEGIRLTHQPSPWVSDYGQLILTGQHGELAVGEESRWSSYDNEGCVFQPAYMKGTVYRDRYTFELAPTNSGAVIRFTFSDGGVNRVNVIGAAKTVFEYERETGFVVGFTTASARSLKYGELREYFAIKLDVPFTLEKADNALSFVTDALAVQCRFATSFISVEQAKLNFTRELEGRSLEEVSAAARAEWEEILSRIAIEDSNEERKAVFYSCLYRSFLWPRKFWETNERGEIKHLNMETGEIVDGYMYVDNGFWDTYRTLFPLLSVLDPKLYAEMSEGFYNYYKDSGWLPKWLSPDNFNCMPGMLIEAVMSDAIVKGIVDRDTGEKYLEALLHNGESDSGIAGVGRVAAKEYRKFGYVPYTAAKESVNETLDCCYGDYCIAQAAKFLGHDDIAARYYGYAKNYGNLFDKETGFMRGKDENGSFRDEAFDCFAWGRDYTEGSAWQSSFAVYHDIEGLDGLYGGKLADKIDELLAAPARFNVGGYRCEIHEMSEMVAGGFGQCAISNQPSFHIPYIYSELGNVEKTAGLIEWLSGGFTDTADGFPGDEDNGSMSSWFILGCLGFYQMAPSRPDFTMSVPLFDKIAVRLGNGKTLLIEKGKYNVRAMRNRISYEELMKGGELADKVNLRK